MVAHRISVSQEKFSEGCEFESRQGLFALPFSHSFYLDACRSNALNEANFFHFLVSVLKRLHGLCALTAFIFFCQYILGKRLRRGATKL